MVGIVINEKKRAMINDNNYNKEIYDLSNPIKLEKLITALERINKILINKDTDSKE